MNNFVPLTICLTYKIITCYAAKMKRHINGKEVTNRESEICVHFKLSLAYFTMVKKMVGRLTNRLEDGGKNMCVL